MRRSVCRIGFQRLNHVVANAYKPPDLSRVSSMWDRMNPLLRDEIQEYLAWKMEGPWKDMTIDECKVMYYISYGEWGPRSGNSKSTVPPAQITMPYIALKSLFSIILFVATGVSVVNLSQDKNIESKLKEMQKNSVDNS